MADVPDRRPVTSELWRNLGRAGRHGAPGCRFQRTRMSADRTLMSVIRTSLSLIGFGFTISQVFQKLYEAQVLKSSMAPSLFGEALVALGIGMLVLGLVYQFAFMRELRRQREQMRLDGLIHAETNFPGFADRDRGGVAPGNRRPRHSEHGLSHRSVRVAEDNRNAPDRRVPPACGSFFRSWIIVLPLVRSSIARIR